MSVAVAKLASFSCAAFEVRLGQDRLVELAVESRMLPISASVRLALEKLARLASASNSIAVGEFGIAEIGLDQIRLVEIGSGEVGAGKVRSAQHRAMEARAGEVRAGEIGAGQVAPLETHSGEIAARTVFRLTGDERRDVSVLRHRSAACQPCAAKTGGNDGRGDQRPRALADPGRACSNPCAHRRLT